MSPGKKFWLTAALLLAAWLMPDEALCYDKDPYLRKSIIGRVYLVYETFDATYGNRKTTSARFQQTYSLDTKGNLLSRNLITYDAGVTWNLNDYNTNTSATNSKTTKYYARTTILPRSAIPLTLHWSADTNLANTSPSNTPATQSVNKVYGLDWSGKFRTLPTTRISAETTENNSDNYQTRSNRYSLDMEKELGPTKNHLNFNEQNTQTAPAGTSTNQYSLNIDNKTKIGRGTDLIAGFTKGETGSTTQGAASTTQGISLLLNSKPSDEFTQLHSYNFFSNKSAGNTQEGTTYAGSLNYNTAKALNSNITLDINNSKADSPTSKTRSDNLISSANVRLNLTTHWFMSQYLFIDNTKTDSNVPTVNYNSHSIFKSLTALNYNRAFKWTSLSAHYGAGYTKENYIQPPIVGTGSTRGTPIAGKGLAQDASIALNNINVTKYAGFDASAKFTNVENSIGQRNNSSRSYYLHGFNKEGRKYVTLSTSYTKSFNKSWNNLYDTVNDRYMLIASSNYFKYTTLNYTGSYSSTYNSIDGIAKYSSNIFLLGYNRPLFSGTFTSTFNYGTSDSTSRGRVSTATSENAAVGYSRTVYEGKFSTALNHSSSRSFNSTTSTNERDQTISQNFSGNTSVTDINHAMISYGRTVYKGALTTSLDYSSKHEAYQLTFRDESTQKIGLKYDRRTFNGNLSLLYNTSTQSIATPSGASSTARTDYSARYSKILFRRVSWNAYYSVNNTEVIYSKFPTDFTSTTYYSNAFAYQLRQWSFTAEQSYKTTQSQLGMNTTEAKMMLTAERTFFRVF